MFQRGSGPGPVAASWGSPVALARLEHHHQPPADVQSASGPAPAGAPAARVRLAGITSPRAAPTGLAGPAGHRSARETSRGYRGEPAAAYVEHPTTSRDPKTGVGADGQARAPHHATPKRGLPQVSAQVPSKWPAHQCEPAVEGASPVEVEPPNAATEAGVKCCSNGGSAGTGDRGLRLLRFLAVDSVPRLSAVFSGLTEEITKDHANGGLLDCLLYGGVSKLTSIRPQEIPSGNRVAS